MRIPFRSNKKTDQLPPFFLPDQILVTTNHGLYIEQYQPNIEAIARTVTEDTINDHLKFLNNRPVYTFRQGTENSMLPFEMPAADKIKISSIKLYAMVRTYPRTVARMIRRRHTRDKDNLVKGLKSTWVIILILVALFIILMLSVTIIGAINEDSDSPANTTDDPGYSIEYSVDDSGKPNPKLEKGQSLTVPIEPGVTTTQDKDLPRAVKTEENIPRGVLIDGTE